MTEKEAKDMYDFAKSMQQIIDSPANKEFFERERKKRNEKTKGGSYGTSAQRKF